MLKKINWKTYLNTFYDFIKKNSVTNNTDTFDTLIFYRIDSGYLVVTFKYLDFYIQTHKLIDELQYEYDTMINEVEDEALQPVFIDWLNDKYLDSRGIKEELWLITLAWIYLN